jgi:hypothetical protein
MVGCMCGPNNDITKFQLKFLKKRDITCIDTRLIAYEDSILLPLGKLSQESHVRAFFAIGKVELFKCQTLKKQNNMSVLWPKVSSLGLFHSRLSSF